VAVAAERYFDLTSVASSSITADQWVILVIWSLCGGIGAGALVYWSAKRETEDASENLVLRETIVALNDSRSTVLAILWVLADAQNVLRGLSGQQRSIALGEFMRAAVDAAARLMEALKSNGANLQVRAVFIQYDESADGADSLDGAPITSRPPAFRRGPLSGHVLEWSQEEHHDFCVAARKLMKEGPPYYLVGDCDSQDPTTQALQLPGYPDHYLRVPVVSGGVKWGLLCVDIWGEQLWNSGDYEAVVTVAKMLGVGLAGGRR
jgi:hypothetical protein